VEVWGSRKQRPGMEGGEGINKNADRGAANGKEIDGEGVSEAKIDSLEFGGVVVGVTEREEHGGLYNTWGFGVQNKRKKPKTSEGTHAKRSKTRKTDP